MKKLLVPVLMIVFTAAMLTSCKGQNKQELQPKSFDSAIGASNHILVLDVRTEGEYAKGHIKGAQNIDVEGDNFVKNITALDKKTPVYVYCHSGRRSDNAAGQMRKMGFVNVYELQGGIAAWEDAGLPTE